MVITMNKKVPVIGIAVMLVALSALAMMPTVSAASAKSVYYWNPGEDMATWTNGTPEPKGTDPNVNHVMTRMWLRDATGYNQGGYNDWIKVPSAFTVYPAFATSGYPAYVNGYDIETNWTPAHIGQIVQVVGEVVMGYEGWTTDQNYTALCSMASVSGVQTLGDGVMLEPMPTIIQNGADQVEFTAMAFLADEAGDYAAPWEDNTADLVSYQVEYSNTPAVEPWNIDGTIAQVPAHGLLQYTPVGISDGDHVRIRPLIKGRGYDIASGELNGTIGTSSWINWTVSTPPHETTLHAGWNLINVARDNATMATAADLATAIERDTQLDVTVVDDWESGWVDYIRRDGTTLAMLNQFAGTSFALTAGESYMVFCAENGSKAGAGYIFYDSAAQYASAPAAVAVSVGWNNLALPYATVAVDATALMADVDADIAGTSDKVSNLTAADTWESWDGAVGTNFGVQQGLVAYGIAENANGFFLLANTAGAWTSNL